MAGPAAAQRRLQRGGRPAVERVRLRADALRRDAARRVGRARARRRHGRRRRVRVAVLPVVPARLRRPAAHAVARRRRARARRDARLQRLASRRVVRRAPRPLRPEPDRVPARSRRSRREEIRRNAARGFKAVTFSEAPDKLGLPTIHSGHWDPLFAACAETGTVLCLHVGSSGTSPTTSADAPPEIPAVLFGAYGMYSAVDWLYSKVPVRFPDIRICLSEGGIGWVAGILDRLDHCYRYQLGYLPTWRDVDESPAEVLRRNFWFCALDDDAGHVGARPHRRRPHPRRVRLPARRLVVARHAGDAHAPAPRPGRARRRRRAASRGRTRRSCSGTRCPPNCSGDRSRSRRRRAERPRAARRRSRSSRSRSGAALTWREYDERSTRMAAALRDRGCERGRPGRVPAARRPGRARGDARRREGGLRRRRHRRAGRRARGRAPRRADRRAHAAHRRRAAAAGDAPRVRDRPDRRATSCGSSTRRRARPACRRS